MIEAMLIKACWATLGSGLDLATCLKLTASCPCPAPWAVSPRLWLRWSELVGLPWSSTNWVRERKQSGLDSRSLSISPSLPYASWGCGLWLNTLSSGLASLAAFGKRCLQPHSYSHLFSTAGWEMSWAVRWNFNRPWNCTAMKTPMKRMALPLQVDLPLLSCPLGIRFFLFWYLDTDGFSWGCRGGILGGCCPLSAPTSSTPRCGRDLFLFVGCRCRVFRGSASARFVRRRLWCCNGVWGHAVLRSVSRWSGPLSPAHLSRWCCFLLRERERENIKSEHQYISLEEKKKPHWLRRWGKGSISSEAHSTSITFTDSNALYSRITGCLQAQRL